LEEEFNRSRGFESHQQQHGEEIVSLDMKSDDVIGLINMDDDVTCSICNDTFEFPYLLDLHRKIVHEVTKKAKFVSKTNVAPKKKGCHKKLF
jgi:hypothetical protein